MFMIRVLCVQDWEQCEKGIAASHEKLRGFKQKLSVPLPDHHEDLHTEQIRCKVHVHTHTQTNLTQLVSCGLLEDCQSSYLSFHLFFSFEERMEFRLFNSYVESFSKFF